MELKTMKNKPTLLEINLSDMGISEAQVHRLSNVMIIGYDTDEVFTFIDRLEENTLTVDQKLDIAELFDEISDRLGTRTREVPKPIFKNDLDQGGVGATSGGIKYNSPYEKTVEGMLSPDYKERFIAEYQQTKMRYEKLKAFCNRIEAAEMTAHKGALGVEMPKHDCPLELLREQQFNMGKYLHCLEIRAVIEGIDLT